MNLFVFIIFIFTSTLLWGIVMLLNHHRLGLESQNNWITERILVAPLTQRQSTNVDFAPHNLCQPRVKSVDFFLVFYIFFCHLALSPFGKYVNRLTRLLMRRGCALQLSTLSAWINNCTAKLMALKIVHFVFQIGIESYTIISQCWYINKFELIFIINLLNLSLLST